MDTTSLLNILSAQARSKLDGRVISYVASCTFMQTDPVALMGSSISDEQVAMLRNVSSLEQITVLMDGDEPGRLAAEKVIPPLAAHFWVRNATIHLPDDGQPDSIREKLLLKLVEV